MSALRRLVFLHIATDAFYVSLLHSVYLLQVVSAVNAVLFQSRPPILEIVQYSCRNTNDIVQGGKVEHVAAAILAELSLEWLATVRHC